MNAGHLFERVVRKGLTEGDEIPRGTRRSTSQRGAHRALPGLSLGEGRRHRTLQEVNVRTEALKSPRANRFTPHVPGRFRLTT